MPVLEGVGLHDKEISKLKADGLRTPEKMQKHPRPLHPEHAPKELHKLEEQIPRFTDEEFKRYVEEPSRFFADALDAALRCSYIIGELLGHIRRVEELKKPEERVAAHLMMLKLFFSNYDFNFLKYDRDIEYYEFKESVTGHFWQTLREMCRKAYPEKVDEYFLKLTSGILPYKTIKYSLSRWSIKQMLEKRNINIIDAERALREIKGTDKALYDTILRTAENFNKYPKDLLNDVKTAREVDIDRLTKVKMENQEIFFKVYKRLMTQNPADAEDLNDAYRAVDLIMRLNEKLNFLTSGKTVQGNGYFYNDSLKLSFARIAEAAAANPKLIRDKAAFERAMKEVTDLKPVGDTPAIKWFLTEFENHKFFSEEVNKLYDEELKRWTR